MNTGTDISALCFEFTGALTEVFAENSAGPARQVVGSLARALLLPSRSTQNYDEHAYFPLAVETAFIQWEAMPQNADSLIPG